MVLGLRLSVLVGWLVVVSIVLNVALGLGFWFIACCGWYLLMVWLGLDFGLVVYYVLVVRVVMDFGDFRLL